MRAEVPHLNSTSVLPTTPQYMLTYDDRIAYGTYFFEMAGVGNAFENSCILSGVGVAAILVCVAIMPRFGRRRRFLTTSLIICGFTQLIVAVVYTKRDLNNPELTGKLIVAFSIIYIVAYNGGMSSFAWVAGGEIPRQSLRSYTFGAAAAIGFLGAWLAAFTAPYFINPASLNWGPQCKCPSSCFNARKHQLTCFKQTATSGSHPASSPQLLSTFSSPRQRAAHWKRSTSSSKPVYRPGSGQATRPLLRASRRSLFQQLPTPSRVVRSVSRLLMPQWR